MYGEFVIALMILLAVSMVGVKAQNANQNLKATAPDSDCVKVSLTGCTTLLFGQSKTDKIDKGERKDVSTRPVPMGTMHESSQTRELLIELKKEPSFDKKSFFIEIAIKNNSQNRIVLTWSTLDLDLQTSSEEKGPGRRLGYWAPRVMSNWILLEPKSANPKAISIAPKETLTARLDILKLKWGLGMAGGYPAEKFSEVVKSGKYDLTIHINGKFSDQEKKMNSRRDRQE